MYPSSYSRADSETDAASDAAPDAGPDTEALSKPDGGSDADADAACCSVCQEDIYPDEPLTYLHAHLDTMHAFHTVCISQWLTQNATCPICREPAGTPPTDRNVNPQFFGADDDNNDDHADRRVRARNGSGRAGGGQQRGRGRGRAVNGGRRACSRSGCNNLLSAADSRDGRRTLCFWCR